MTTTDHPDFPLRPTLPQPGPGGQIVLLTGATGYVGGRLLRELQKLPLRLRCLARKPAYLKSKAGPLVEIAEGDVMDPASLTRALQGVRTAYYLVHSMGTSQAFEDQDRTAALNFAQAAKEAGVSKIIYLGGLGRTGLSAHLSSRQEVGQILRDSGVPTVEFQASIILGSGSLSFELVRALVERLPVMIAPKWVSVLCQPIAIEDVVRYLVEALEMDFFRSEVFQIGSRERVSYGGLMAQYAKLRGLRRLVIPVPVLTPRLSSLWLGLVTPVYARVGRALIEGVRNATIVTDPKALGVFAVRPMGVGQAMERALNNEDAEFSATRWCDSLSSGAEARPFGGTIVGSRFVDSRAMESLLTPEKLFQKVESIGGSKGWYYGNFLWKLRGWLDLLAGGVGLRRGRRDPLRLSPGDTVDFWRVEAVERPRLLRLAAEMKLPGRAWLQFEVEAKGTGSLIRQTALFDAQGLGGRLYWWALYPLHQLVFQGMLRNLVKGD